MTTTKIQIRFNDIDLAGHVHNAVYLSYFEQGRLDFFNLIAGKDWDWRKQGLILGRNEIDYLKPIRLYDDVHVKTSCDHVGTKSFSLSYEIFSMNGEMKVLHTKGRSIMVCIDYTTNQTVDVYPSWKEKLLNQAS
jgi:acyl-CoA thioester hydrolase